MLGLQLAFGVGSGLGLGLGDLAPNGSDVPGPPASRPAPQPTEPGSIAGAAGTDFPPPATLAYSQKKR